MKKILSFKICIATILGLFNTYAIANHHENHSENKEQKASTKSYYKKRGQSISQDGSVKTIKEAQNKLNEKGFLAKKASGVVDTDTREALKSFQEKNNITPSGTLDAATLAKLGLGSTNQKSM